MATTIATLDSLRADQVKKGDRVASILGSPLHLVLSVQRARGDRSVLLVTDKDGGGSLEYPDTMLYVIRTERKR